MMTAEYDVLIVGAGHGGAQAAIGLRQEGFRGSVAIIGDEVDLPYERPPLSKDYLSGKKNFERIMIRPATFWAERFIDMWLGSRVVAVDPQAHLVTTSDGKTIGYHYLIWAAGGSPRQLTCSGHSLRGVHAVRTRDDVDQIMRELSCTNRVVIIGGGYIGLEAAAVLVTLGKQVILLEMLDRVLARVAGEPLSRFYENEHRAHGVDVRTNVKVKCIEEENGIVCGVRLEDDDVLTCEMVIVGIGILPSVDPLIAAGAEGGNGVAVDKYCRTSLASVFAIGDCALHANRFAGGTHIRLESVQNANDQATLVAKIIMGGEHIYDAVPWFWSNQYDLRLQTIGISSGYDDVVIRGDPATRSFSLVYLNQGSIIALDCVNSVKDYVQGRALVLNAARIAKDRLKESRTMLKDMPSE